MGSQLGRLEAAKADAIAREDYDAAKSLKVDIHTLLRTHKLQLCTLQLHLLWLSLCVQKRRCPGRVRVLWDLTPFLVHSTCVWLQAEITWLRAGVAGRQDQPQQQQHARQHRQLQPAGGGGIPEPAVQALPGTRASPQQAPATPASSSPLDEQPVGSGSSRNAQLPPEVLDPYSMPVRVLGHIADGISSSHTGGCQVTYTGWLPAICKTCSWQPNRAGERGLTAIVAIPNSSHMAK